MTTVESWRSLLKHGQQFHSYARTPQNNVCVCARVRVLVPACASACVCVVLATGRPQQRYSQSSERETTQTPSNSRTRKHERFIRPEGEDTIRRDLRNTRLRGRSQTQKSTCHATP